jgi:hypothetical protein
LVLKKHLANTWLHLSQIMLSSSLSELIFNGSFPKHLLVRDDRLLCGACHVLPFVSMNIVVLNREAPATYFG